MKFGRLVVENFMSIEYAETYFNDRGLVLIQGKNEDADAFESNGAGKSTLFSEAPTWPLPIFVFDEDVDVLTICLDVHRELDDL